MRRRARVSYTHGMKTLVPLLLVLCACSKEEAPPTAPAPTAPAPAKTSPKPALPTAPLFEDLTASSGLTFVHDAGRMGNRELPETLGGGVAWLDADGDGHLDLYLAQSGPLREVDGSEDRATAANQLWRGDGAGHFQLVPGAAGDQGYGQGVHAADLDGDGRCDLMALNWGTNGLWRNTPEAVTGFTDTTAPWGMAAVHNWSVSSAVLDFDADGDLDYYIANYLDVAPRAYLDPALNPNAPGPHKGYPHPDRYPAQADELWRNDLDTTGAFTDVTTAMHVAELDPQKGLGVIPTDIELDGWIDLYIANDATPNMLLHNLAGKDFSEDARKLGLAYNESGDTEAGMGVDTIDVDRDGDLDLFVTNLDMETNSLYLNKSFARPRRAAPTDPPKPGRLGFRDQTLRMGLGAPSRGLVGFGLLFDDADLDGDSDVIIVNGHVVDNIEEISDTRLYAQPNQIYLNDGNAHFTEAPPALLPPGFLATTVSRGSALGDLDNDLDLDLAVGNNNTPANLFRATPPARPRLALRLVGPAKNTEGLGATIWLHFQDAPTWLGRMDRSKSYGSASDAQIIVGYPQPTTGTTAISGTLGGTSNTTGSPSGTSNTTSATSQATATLTNIEVLWPGGERETFTTFPASLATKGGALTLHYGDAE